MQDQPNEWIVYAVPGTEDRVQYWARGTSTFSSTFSYGAFPFDKQRLQFRIMTEVRANHDWLDDSQRRQWSSSDFFVALLFLKNSCLPNPVHLGAFDNSQSQ